MASNDSRMRYSSSDPGSSVRHRSTAMRRIAIDAAATVAASTESGSRPSRRATRDASSFSLPARIS
ncbi:hypothetical protein BFG51_08485 [Dietzia alimentaria]|nr:hypothetical protein BFG51_08485 [Dietzia alimentaria]